MIVASYNVHGGIGLDGRYAPARIVRVVRELAADVIALQELRDNLLEELRRVTGYNAIAGPTMTRADGIFGNGLLTRFPVVSIGHIRLDVERREPRGAIDAVIACDSVRMRVIATHLGLKSAERHEQIARLLELVRADAQAPTLLLGDINEWLLRRPALRALQAHFGESPARATFPSWLPLLALDRIWITPAHALGQVRVHRSRTARMASDHLPLVAELTVAADTPS